jgi:hypothetical protein
MRSGKVYMIPFSTKFDACEAIRFGMSVVKLVPPLGSIPISTRIFLAVALLLPALKRISTTWASPGVALSTVTHEPFVPFPGVIATPGVVVGVVYDDATVVNRVSLVPSIRVASLA